MKQIPERKDATPQEFLASEKLLSLVANTVYYRTRSQINNYAPVPTVTCELPLRLQIRTFPGIQDTQDDD